MSAFIEKADYLLNITDHRINQIIEDTDAILDDAEDTAIAVVKDALKARYDVDSIFATVGAARPKNVMLWVKRLAIYYIYDRIPDDLVPERVVKNYNEVMDHLEAISDGKRSVDLPILIDADGNKSTKFRYGSQPARSH